MFEKVHVPLLGLIENMSYFITPGGERVEIFGHGGGQAEAKRQGLNFLGEIPIYMEIRAGGDGGKPVVTQTPDEPAGRVFLELARVLQKRLG
jgi:ATP-binding protein involved in chromosome partitioning